MNWKDLKSEAGFSLIEMIVGAAISVFASLIILLFMSQTNRSMASARARESVERQIQMVESYIRQLYKVMGNPVIPNGGYTPGWGPTYVLEYGNINVGTFPLGFETEILPRYYKSGVPTWDRINMRTECVDLPASWPQTLDFPESECIDCPAGQYPRFRMERFENTDPANSRWIKTIPTVGNQGYAVSMAGFSVCLQEDQLGYGGVSDSITRRYYYTGYFINKDRKINEVKVSAVYNLRESESDKDFDFVEDPVE